MIKNLLFVCILLFVSSDVILAQNKINLNSLPDVADYTVIRSNPEADTVIIAIHGGPTPILFPGDFEFFEDIPTFSVVEMQQKQHLNPEIMANSAMTLNEAIVYNDTTVALLRKVVNHYNDQSKIVVLMGHSFGAFLLPEYLDDYGNDDIHRVIPMAGRLNMNQEVVDAFATGFFAGFINGLTVQVDSDQADPSEFAAMKLQAGVGYNRYVDSLSTMDLSKLMYVYGTHDQAVGRLLPEELDMLANTNATILAVQNGSHDSPFFLPQVTAILDFIRTDPMTTSLLEFEIVKANVKIFPTVVENDLNIIAEKNGQLIIYNLNGQILFQKECLIGNQQFSLIDVPNGFYLATYLTTDDNELTSEKLVIRR